MVYYEKDRKYRFHVEREVVKPKARGNDSQCSETYSFNSFEEAFDFYQKMYQMDKMSWDMLKDEYMNRGIADESKGPNNYSFSLYRRYLSVKLIEAGDVAREAFCLEG